MDMGFENLNRNIFKGIVLCFTGGGLFGVIEYLEIRIIGSAAEGAKAFFATLIYSFLSLLLAALLGLALSVLNRLKPTKK